MTCKPILLLAFAAVGVLSRPMVLDASAIQGQETFNGASLDNVKQWNYLPTFNTESNAQRQLDGTIRMSDKTFTDEAVAQASSPIGKESHSQDVDQTSGPAIDPRIMTETPITGGNVTPIGRKGAQPGAPSPPGTNATTDGTRGTPAGKPETPNTVLIKGKSGQPAAGQDPIKTLNAPQDGIGLHSVNSTSSNEVPIFGKASQAADASPHVLGNKIESRTAPASDSSSESKPCDLPKDGAATNSASSLPSLDGALPKETLLWPTEMPLNVASTPNSSCNGGPECQHPTALQDPAIQGLPTAVSSGGLPMFPIIDPSAPGVSGTPQGSSQLFKELPFPSTQFDTSLGPIVSSSMPTTISGSASGPQIVYHKCAGPQDPNVLPFNGASTSDVDQKDISDEEQGAPIVAGNHVPVFGKGHRSH